MSVFGGTADHVPVRSEPPFLAEAVEKVCPGVVPALPIEINYRKRNSTKAVSAERHDEEMNFTVSTR